MIHQTRSHLSETRRTSWLQYCHTSHGANELPQCRQYVSWVRICSCHTHTCTHTTRIAGMLPNLVSCSSQPGKLLVLNITDNNSTSPSPQACPSTCPHADTNGMRVPSLSPLPIRPPHSTSSSLPSSVPQHRTTMDLPSPPHPSLHT